MSYNMIIYIYIVCITICVIHLRQKSFSGCCVCLSTRASGVSWGWIPFLGGRSSRPRQNHPETGDFTCRLMEKPCVLQLKKKKQLVLVNIPICVVPEFPLWTSHTIWPVGFRRLKHWKFPSAKALHGAQHAPNVATGSAAQLSGQRWRFSRNWPQTWWLMLMNGD